MVIEEPTAASTISQALNKARAIALQTTEQTAIAVLKGEIIIQMSKDIGPKVAFATVRERVRWPLDHVVDDPDFIELFDLLMNLGVGRNTYADDLLDFITKYANWK